MPDGRGSWKGIKGVTSDGDVFLPHLGGWWWVGGRKMMCVRAGLTQLEIRKELATFLWRNEDIKDTTRSRVHHIKRSI